MSRQGTPTLAEARPFVPMPWADEALCREVDPELFWPQVMGDQCLEAKAVCHRCPVRLACTVAAVAGEEWRGGGVWGGFTSHRLQAIQPGFEAEAIAADHARWEAREERLRRKAQEKERARVRDRRKAS